MEFWLINGGASSIIDLLSCLGDRSLDVDRDIRFLMTGFGCLPPPSASSSSGGRYFSSVMKGNLERFLKCVGCDYYIAH